MEPVYWRPRRIDKFPDRKSTRLNSSHTVISYAVFCLKKKKKKRQQNSALHLGSSLVQHKPMTSRHINCLKTLGKKHIATATSKSTYDWPSAVFSTASL